MADTDWQAEAEHLHGAVDRAQRMICEKDRELLQGEALDAVLRRVPALSPVQTLLLAKSIAAGLNVAHTKGIVHRDLKPANIYLHRDPVTLDVIPKILDFGISKVTGPEAIDHHATHTGTVVGSPTYMSPEQARGVSDIDARADIWSVGVLMYKCLTGRAPFNAANYNALMVSIMTEPHPPVQKFAPTVPPFVGASWHLGQISDADYLPFFSNRCVGVAIAQATESFRGVGGRVTALCGHSHSPGRYEAAEGLEVLTGGAEYFAPAVCGVFEFATVAKSSARLSETSDGAGGSALLNAAVEVEER